ncbi:PAS domain-containing protein [Edaphobacter dinghuensis]|uniref:PAS domain-containing protein n=1 Tax=Edaphobacter dinghuensis TaxID=1560005 RepID=UPI001665C3F1|nr:PAS domain-containing protein [Edaphobacter dinghuensis]
MSACLAVVGFIALKNRRFAEAMVEIVFLRRIVHWAPIPLVLFGRERIVEYCNAAFEALYGWSFEELKGRPLPIPDRELETWHELEQGLRSGREFRNVRAVRIRKDGSEINVRISGVPLTDDNGNPAGLVGLAVKDDSNSSPDLSPSTLQFIATRCGDFVCLTDEGHRIHFLNDTAREVLGIDIKSPQASLNLLDFVFPEDHQRIVPELSHLPLHGSLPSVWLRIPDRRSDGFIQIHGGVYVLPDEQASGGKQFAYVCQRVNESSGLQEPQVPESLPSQPDLRMCRQP